MNPWTPNGTPFCWLPKAGVQCIEENLELGAAASAKLVYLALCRIASNEGSAVFAKPINYIATLASLHRRTVERRLPDLERLGLVAVARPRIPGTSGRDQGTYTLATLSRNLAAAASPHAVAINRELEKERKIPGRSQPIQPTQPRTVPERIAAENRLKILRGRFQILARDTCEQWQCDANPGLVTERIRLRDQITALENTLL